MRTNIEQDLGLTAGEMRPDPSKANATTPLKTPSAPEKGGIISLPDDAEGLRRTNLPEDAGGLSEDTWREVLAAYHAGATAPVLARRYGVTAAAIYKAAGRDGKRARKRSAIDTTRLTPDDNTNTNPHSNTDIASRTRDALRFSVSLDAMVEVLLAIGQGLQKLATTALKIAGAAQARITREGLPPRRRKLSDKIWKAARYDYEEGDFTAGEIAERYGSTKKTVETRAWREGWSKEVTQAPPPLLPPDDPDQV
ncbi:MAG: hypothetical protein EON93_17740, partial [Burkholderiales bacterium]